MRLRLLRASCLALAGLAAGNLHAQAPAAAPAPARVDEDTVNQIMLPDADLDTVLNVYEQLTGRIVIRPQQLTAATYNLRIKKAVTKAEAIIAIETALAVNGIGLSPLGDKFLKHIERTRLLLHLVDCGDLPMQPPEEAWRVIRQELAGYAPELAHRPTVVVATKVEDEAGRARAQALATAIGQPVLAVSSATGTGLKDLVAAVWSVLSTLPRPFPAD